jgi:integrase
MGYSINFYLDNAISQEKILEVKRSSKKLQKEFNEIISKKELQIFLYLRYSGKTIKTYIERKCTQNQWDCEKQKVNPNYYKSGSVELNKYIENVSYEVGKIFEANNNKAIGTTKDHLKEIVYKLNNKTSNSLLNLSFENAFSEFIKKCEASKQKNTIKSYKSTIIHLKNFSRIKRMSLSFDKIDFEFEDSLRQYFISDVKLTNNTISKYFRVLKTFLNYCLDRGYNHNQIFKKFEVSEKQKEVYALTLDELNRIYTHQFEESRLNKVKDVFCFSCFTGLRFSDVMKLKRENIKDHQVKITIQKTQEDLLMPLNEFALSILQKYLEYENPLPIISSQKTNQYLKEIGKLLNINEPVRTIKYRGIEKIEKYIPKYEILTFHIARKTFITSSLVLGMNERIVKDFSGHRDEESFKRYVNFADDYKRKVMNNVWSKENVQNAFA